MDYVHEVLNDDRLSTGSHPEAVPLIQGAGCMLVWQAIHVVIQ